MTRNAETNRFVKKRADILDAAAILINERGVKGMTFVEVANLVGLNTTSVTYYFRRKEQLAAAVFDGTLDRMAAMADAAAQMPDPRARIGKWVSDNIQMRLEIRRGDTKRVAVLSEMRTLDDDLQQELTAKYLSVFATVRNFFGAPHDDRTRALNTARTHMLFENMFWLPAWLPRYAQGDFPRLERRLLEFFEHGLAVPGQGWAPLPLDLPGDGDEAGPQNFLRVATHMINERGYRGASVDRIAAELNVTKGSFYHHLDAKDDLVLECFRHSYDRVSQAQYAADRIEGSYWLKLTSAMNALFHRQFYNDMPLLRTTALQALPIAMRGQVVDRSNRLARRLAGTIIDGISEGSMRAVDPLIVAQAIMATLNSAYELRGWASRLSRADAVAIYATPLCHGVFAEPMATPA